MRAPILFVYGTRPEALKLAPVVAACQRLGLPIEAWCSNQSPHLLDGIHLKCPAVTTFSPVPALVVVQGDTRTAAHQALRWFEVGVPIFHVEAGVRTGDLTSPFPEEGYRRMIAQIATYHACTTMHGVGNLSKERYGLAAHSCWRLVGSPIVESVRARAVPEPGDPKGLVLLTLHRRENRGRFRQMVEAIGQIFDPMLVVWYAHPNEWAVEEAKDLPVTPSPPLDPTRFARRLASAYCVITDSGGVVEEASALGVPSIQARTVTDRPECLGTGSFLWSAGTVESLSTIAGQVAALDRTTIPRDLYGDGEASERLGAWLAEILATSSS